MFFSEFVLAFCVIGRKCGLVLIGFFLFSLIPPLFFIFFFFLLLCLYNLKEGGTWVT